LAFWIQWLPTRMLDIAFVLILITALLVVVGLCQPLAAYLKLPPPVLLATCPHHPLLARLETRALVVSAWETPRQEGERPRRYYRLTSGGIEVARLELAQLSARRGPVAGASPPWLWLANEAQVPLFTAGADVPSAGRLVHVLHVYFRGALNPFLLMLARLALGSAAMLALRGDLPAALALGWAAAAYLPFVASALAGRFPFLAYALALVPALALATGRVAAKCARCKSWVDVPLRYVAE